MTPTDIFAAALQLPEPWYISSIEFREAVDNPQLRELHIFIDFKAGAKFPCPADGCGAPCSVHDTAERVWRHVNFFQYPCYLHARTPRVKCPDHKVLLAAVPWARPGSGFTLLFEGLTLLLAQDMPVSTAADHLGEHDTRLWRVIEHWVNVAREDLDFSEVEAIGVDETSKRGHNYVTIFVDLIKKRVMHVAEAKDASTVDDFCKAFKARNGAPEAVKVATSDMSLAFKKGIRKNFPNATHVLDHFHVVKLVNDAVDVIRRREAKEQPVLKRTRYLWLKNPADLSEKQQGKLNAVTKQNLKTGRAYRMRLQLQDIYSLTTEELAKEGFKKLIRWMKLSRIDEMKRVGRTLQENIEAILAFWRHPFSNALLEGVNSIIQNIKRRARGFRNNEYFATMIYLVCGGLNFEPHCPFPRSKARMAALV